MRSELKVREETMDNLYPGNPKRKTNQPTTNLMLRAFINIHLITTVIDGKTHISVSELNKTQIQILDLLNIPTQTYSRICQLSFSDCNFSET